MDVGGADTVAFQPVVVSTLPADVADTLAPTFVRSEVAVLDAAYAVWPTRLVKAAHAEPARRTAADPGRFASARQFL